MLTLRGGTNAKMAPPVDYMARVLLPTLRRLCGVDVQLDIVRRGFFPRGGGEVRLAARPLETPLPPLQLEAKGDVVSVRTYVYSAGALPPTIAARIATAARVRRRVDGGGNFDAPLSRTCLSVARRESQKPLRRHFGGDILADAEVVIHTPAEALGNGCGVLYACLGRARSFSCHAPRLTARMHWSSARVSRQAGIGNEHGLFIGRVGVGRARYAVRLSKRLGTKNCADDVCCYSGCASVMQASRRRRWARKRLTR